MCANKIQKKRETRWLCGVRPKNKRKYICECVQIKYRKKGGCGVWPKNKRQIYLQISANKIQKRKRQKRRSGKINELQTCGASYIILNRR